jgi:hypothetical protein
LAGDFSLQNISPAINTGSNSFYLAGQTPNIYLVTTDSVGNSRFYNNGIVDMGGYKYQEALPCTTPTPSAVAQSFCGTATVTNLTATGTALKWYNVATGCTALVSAKNLFTGTYYVSQTLNGCEGTRTAVAIKANPNITPTFATIPAICSGTTLSPLPTTSTNSITGSWLPGLNNTAMTTYTFTPSTGQCATISTRTIEVITINVSTILDNVTITPVQSGASYQWIDCDNGNALLTGETSQDFIATQNGQYAVIIDHNGCRMVSDCVTITSLGTKETEVRNKLTLYPNTASSVITIDTQENIRLIWITDISGKTITVQHFGNKIGVKALQEGVYFVHIFTEENRYIQKIRKRKVFVKIVIGI